ncbi:MAG TPA: RtcB family protein [Candidatus Pacearchaeota archaeon]|nr:RtcB family protein [Candidatus Pacearchaeota archaeon]
MKTIETEKIPIKMWLEEIEDNTMEQVKNIANLPFAFKHIAIMPDSHLGYGMPIGGVLATKDVIIPNAVGVDIGCGMCAVKTSLTELNTETLKKIMSEIRKTVPVGFAKHKETQDIKLPLPWISRGEYQGKLYPIIEKESEKMFHQVGTLGGGNHFIEIQKGNDGHIWIMIHSGSRNLGFTVANYYNKLAIKLNEKWRTQVPGEWELAFLPIDSDEGQAYIKEMQYCVDFALTNRKLMMERILEIFQIQFTLQSPMFEALEFINIAHNYATLEHHFGKNVWVHRKGATLATEDTVGIIPGSQGTKSYIVKGKGNIFSFKSCSHGAGRKMGRKQAEKTLNLEEEVKKLDDQNVLHAIRGVKDLDEASGAYKSIDEVMRNQSDLVEILVELSPLGVIKG